MKPEKTDIPLGRAEPSRIGDHREYPPPPPHPSPPGMENAIKRMTPVKNLPYPCDIALLTEFVFK